MLPRRTLRFALAAGLLGCAPAAVTTPAPAAPDAKAVVRRPRLAIVLVVDQMRADYLERYADLYRGGLARLRREGAWFTRAHLRHALSYTAPGHASVSTGSDPARHGVIANDWFDRASRSEMYAAEDPSTPLVFTTNTDVKLPGRSPRQLERPALGDWLKAREPAARVFSVALKDRAAVLMGGHKPDRAYWYSAEVAGYVSSTWYAGGAPPPSWVAEFNASGVVFDHFTRGWIRSRDISAYLRSGPDHVDAEADGEQTRFPHLFDDGTPAAREAYAKKLLTTPFGDELTLRFARKLIEVEQLGADDTPDLLMISCSSADYIGHAYGPFSHEAQDYYLRLDDRLGELLAYLDEHVGKDSYVLALTADHGALPLPEEARLRGHGSARRVTGPAYRARANEAVAGALAQLGLNKEALLYLGEDGVWLDIEASTGKASPATVREAVARALRGLDFVADTFTSDELAGPTDPARPFHAEYQRSYYAGRSPDIHMRFKQWHLVDALTRGTSHGSPYEYDTHVPVLFFGAGVRAGVQTQAVGTTDVAPTLAELLGVAPPAEIDGRSLAGVVRGSRASGGASNGR
jgi:predicted AlkP superfamily pyrophosphatase or phosphodiesterase